MSASNDPGVVLRRLIDEGFTGGNLDVADELIADDMVEHQDFGPGHAAGAEGVKAVMASLRRAFPDFRLVVEELVVEGDTAWSRNVGTAPTTGRTWATRPPAGGCASRCSTLSACATGGSSSTGACRTGWGR